MNNQYFVMSGRPSDEIFHRTVFGPFATRTEAEAVKHAVLDATHSQNNWLWGPEIQENFVPDQVNEQSFAVTPAEVISYLGI